MMAPAPVRHQLKLAQSPVNLRHRSLPPLPAAYRRLLKEREAAALERGRAEAEQGLAAQIVSQRQEMVQLQDGVLQAIHDAVSQVVRDTERTLVDLALATASRLVSGLPISAEVVAAAIREALTQVEETANVHILLHAEDLALLRSSASELVADAGSGRLRLTVSPEVTRGGCVVRTHFGEVDARRETKLEQIRKALTD